MTNKLMLFFSCFSLVVAGVITNVRQLLRFQTRVVMAPYLATPSTFLSLLCAFGF